MSKYMTNAFRALHLLEDDDIKRLNTGSHQYADTQRHNKEVADKYASDVDKYTNDLNTFIDKHPDTTDYYMGFDPEERMYAREYSNIKHNLKDYKDLKSTADIVIDREKKRHKQAIMKDRYADLENNLSKNRRQLSTDKQHIEDLRNRKMRSMSDDENEYADNEIKNTQSRIDSLLKRRPTNESFYRNHKRYRRNYK